MTKRYNVTAIDSRLVFFDRKNIDTAETYQIDFTPWAEDNNNITSVTWEVAKGNASITNEALASNVASALISFPNQEKLLIKVTADTGTQKKVIFIKILIKDEDNFFLNDYTGCIW